MAKKEPILQLTSYEELLGINASEDKIVYLPYEYLYPSPYQYRDKYLTPAQIQDNVEKLAFDVKVDGKIRQPCIVRFKRPKKENEYELVVGHNRRRVAQYLTEVEHLDGYRLVPCIILELTDAQAEYLCNSSNNMRPKTEYEIMHELETKMRILKESPEDFPRLQGPGRMVEKLAQEMYLSKSTAGEYLQISKNLSENAMESFKQGTLNKSAAVSMSSLSHEEQNKLIDAGVTKQKDIKAYKAEKIEKTVHRTTVTNTVKTVTACNIEEQNSDTENEESATVVDVLPGQYRVANTDMELEEESAGNKDEETAADSFEVSKEGRCNCPNCKRPSRIEDIITFYGKGYCKKDCLFDLLIDLADTGVITLDRSAVNTKGIVIHS